MNQERITFKQLQSRLPQLFEQVFPDRLHPRKVLIVPSLTLDTEVLSKISGVHHYEERMLCLLLLLRMPRTQIIYLSSTEISERIIDYYLHLLSGVPHQHARERLTLIACHDASSLSLTKKVLSRPRIINRIKEALGDRANAHMVCFNVTSLELELALKLEIPIYGCEPNLLHLGTKSGGRKLFREAGMRIPRGFEDLNNSTDLIQALNELKLENPSLRKAVVKLNEGFSGEGNAVFKYKSSPQGRSLDIALEDLTFEAKDMTPNLFETKLGEMGGIVEEFIEGSELRSPSAQYRINPQGAAEAISTHDQVLGGPSGQIFLGCRFPADEAYRLEIQNEGQKAANSLKEKGVLGRFGIDFISVWEKDKWIHYAIEINLRKGGTTHPFIMLQYLTDGIYDADTGLFRLAEGKSRYYYATDNLESEIYKGLTPRDLIDISTIKDIHFNTATNTGVVFHLIGALSEFGKIGVVCVGKSHDQADQLYQHTVEMLNTEESL